MESTLQNRALIATGTNHKATTILYWIATALFIVLMPNRGVIGGGDVANNPFGTDWSVVASDDFNGDGKPDILSNRRNFSPAVARIRAGLFGKISAD